MDTKTYKFWADFFQQAGEGQARFDEVRKWMEQGIQSTGGIYDTFRKWFETTTGKPAGQSTEVYEEMLAAFNRTIQQFLNDFGVIPKAAYHDLEEKNKAFKQRIEEQEETISAPAPDACRQGNWPRGQCRPVFRCYGIAAAVVQAMDRPVQAP